MKLETIKSFILVFLIGTSLLLTFGMWNYQPSVQLLSDAKPEDFSLNGTEESVRTLIEPRQIIFHHFNQHYGFTVPVEQSNFFKEIQQWVLFNFELKKVEENNHEHDVEITFPTPLPMEILDSLFTFQVTNLELPIWSFQKVYFTLDKELRVIRVEFLSIDGRDKAVAVIQDGKNFEQLASYLDNQDLTRFSVFKNGNGESLYIPEGPIQLTRQTKAFSKINANNLVDVLFSDPSIVRQSNYSNIGTTYFTDSSQMSVTQDEARIEYISPGAINETLEPLFAEDLLNKSISDINSYQGWTETFKLMDMNTNENVIRYQMFYNGYPVFSPLSIMEQRWGQRLIEYNRPLFRSNNSLNDNEVTLPTSDKVLVYLEKNYKLEDINDIQVGYQLIYDKDKNIIIYEPCWFMQQQYNKEWIPIHP
ncbi:YycH family regulatory protein [Oceanobacillus sp. Castelsardo]|uniref:YycH family regulatory protein n=1 Tax=Oceanobacillus sp. Castelsardo TaxID=1851204 RepID=UPI000838AF68|nr:two-component system activity regulator YycH [Oceanobacillus sp. Castelsardo]